MSNYVIYIHRNKINGKEYVGMTNNVERRWKNNGIEYKPKGRGKENSRPFWNAIQKYGWNNFTHEIVKSGLTFDEACELEKQYIREHETRERGYNVAEGGNGGRIYKEHPRNRLGQHNSPEQNAKHSEWMKDPKNNFMTNGKVVWDITHPHPRGMTGKHHSDESNRKRSTTLKEKKINCKKISVEFPDGHIVHYDSVGKAEKSIGLTRPVIRRLKESGEPFTIKVKNQYSDRIKHLSGIKIR